MDDRKGAVMADVTLISKEYTSTENAKLYILQGFSDAEVDQAQAIVDSIIADPKLSTLTPKTIRVEDNSDDPGNSLVTIWWEALSELADQDFTTFNSIFNTVFSAPNAWVALHNTLTVRQTKTGSP